MITLFGLKNCDSSRAAKKWLKLNSLDFQFIDVRATPPSVGKINDWCDQAGWETVLNRRGRAWRMISADQRADLIQEKAIDLMSKYPLLIKRPVIEGGKNLVVGFSADVQESLPSNF